MLHEEKEFACSLAHRAAKRIRDGFQETLNTIWKADGTPVTAVDLDINQMVLAAVRERFPGHGVFGEEESESADRDWLWVCDPLDGTFPFLSGLPVSTFSLALVRDGQPLLGVIHDPFLDRQYVAVQGEGAYCNGTRLSTAEDRHHGVAVEWWPTAPYDLNAVRTRLAQEADAPGFWLQMCSVARAACMVASGDLTACLFAGGAAKAVDVAAAKIIVEEAGGCATDLFGEPQRYDGDIRGAILCTRSSFERLREISRSVLEKL